MFIAKGPLGLTLLHCISWWSQTELAKYCSLAAWSAKAPSGTEALFQSSAGLEQQRIPCYRQKSALESRFRAYGQTDQLNSTPIAVQPVHPDLENPLSLERSLKYLAGSDGRPHSNNLSILDG